MNKIIIYNVSILCSIIFSSLIGCSKRKILSNINYITLSTNSTGIIKLFSDSYISYINEVKINGITIEGEIKNEYYIDIDDTNSDEINITLIFKENEQMTTTTNLFNMCSNITKIDLSNFDSSNINDMSYMFYGCTSLISLDFNNFDTSTVVDFNSMFAGCTSLTSLNLNNFGTEQTSYMNNMFSGCSNLTILDISYFTIGENTVINNIFNGCSSLEYINLESANIEQVSFISQITTSVSDRVMICSNNINLGESFNENFLINCNNVINSININNSEEEDNQSNNCYSNNNSNEKFK